MPPAGTPLVAAHNPLRKQTLLGIAPVIPARAEPAAAAAAEVAAPEPPPPPPAPEPPVVAAERVLLTVPAAENPLRKQTLLGMAPPLAALEGRAVPEEEPVDTSSVVTPAVVATDAPTTLDVGMSEPKLAVDNPPVLPTTDSVAPAAPAAVVPTTPHLDHDDLPELKPRRPRWLIPLGVAAALGLLVVGLRSLDRAPSSTPPAAKAAAPRPATPPAPIPAKPKSDDDDDTAGDSHPDPTTPEPEPLKAPPTPSAAAAPAAASAAPSGSVIRINVDSDPPGARLFWKGKEVGTTPFVLELQPGEKHAYELGLPGYTTRKVVIDGAKTEISVGLRPEPGTFIGTKPRK